MVKQPCHNFWQGCFICNYSATDLRWSSRIFFLLLSYNYSGTEGHWFLPDLQISKGTSNIEHPSASQARALRAGRTSNVELRYAFGVSILLKKWAKRYPHSMFDVERSMFDVHLLQAKQISSGDSQSLVPWARIFYFALCHCAFAPLCLSSYLYI